MAVTVSLHWLWKAYRGRITSAYDLRRLAFRLVDADPSLLLVDARPTTNDGPSITFTTCDTMRLFLMARLPRYFGRGFT